MLHSETFVWWLAAWVEFRSHHQQAFAACFCQHTHFVCVCTKLLYKEGTVVLDFLETEYAESYLKYVIDFLTINN